MEEEKREAATGAERTTLELFDAEIITTFGSYSINVYATSEVQAADRAFLAVSSIPVTLVEGGALLITKPDAILGILAKKQEAAQPDPWDIDVVVNVSEGHRPDEIAPFEPYNWLTFIDYLGASHKVHIITVRDKEGLVYQLLNTFDESPAASVLSDKGQGAVLDAWAKQYAPSKYVNVIPHGEITELGEATDYLMDFMKETRPDHKPTNPTAKAFVDWRPQVPRSKGDDK